MTKIQALAWITELKERGGCLIIAKLLWQSHISSIKAVRSGNEHVNRRELVTYLVINYRLSVLDEDEGEPVSSPGMTKFIDQINVLVTSFLATKEKRKTGQE